MKEEIKMLSCECCGTTENLTVGQGTLFDEYNVICQDCLTHAYEQEFTNPVEIALNKLNGLDISEDDIYGFYVEGCKVRMDYFNSKRHLTAVTLVNCCDENEAMDVLCELC